MKALAVILALVALALAMATATTASAAPAESGEHAAKAKPKRHCPAGRKGRPCRRRVRCARRAGARRPKRCRSKARKRSPSPAPGSSPGPVLPGPPPGSSPPADGGPPPPGPGRAMSVAAYEFSLVTSRALLASGSQTIELRNRGEDPHNLVISPDDESHTPLVTWDEQEPGTFVVKDTGLSPGRYLLWCSLEGHEALGMSTTVQVAP